MTRRTQKELTQAGDSKMHKCTMVSHVFLYKVVDTKLNEMKVDAKYANQLPFCCGIFEFILISILWMFSG